MLFRNSEDTLNKDYLLASRCAYAGSDQCLYSVRMVKDGQVTFLTGYLWQSTYNNTGYAAVAGVIPVVSLKSKILTNGQDSSGAWNLIVE